MYPKFQVNSNSTWEWGLDYPVSIIMLPNCLELASSTFERGCKNHFERKQLITVASNLCSKTPFYFTTINKTNLKLLYLVSGVKSKEVQ